MVKLKKVSSLLKKQNKNKKTVKFVKFEWKFKLKLRYYSIIEKKTKDFWSTYSSNLVLLLFCFFLFFKFFYFHQRKF